LQVLVSDLDGTVLDCRERIARAQVAALGALGYHVDLERLMNLYRYSLDTGQLLGALGIRLSRHELARYYSMMDEEFYRGWRWSRVFPEALETLEQLRPRLTGMRLITSRRRIHETRREFRAFGLDRVFEEIYTRGDLAREEGVEEVPLLPFVAHRRRLIRLAIRDLDHGGEVWVVGDTPGELEAARSLGFVAVGVLTGLADRNDLEPHADHIISSIAEIDRLI